MTRSISFIILLIGLALFGCTKDNPEKAEDPTTAAINNLPVNQLQSIGSHNSYRKKTYQPIFDFVMDLQSLLPPNFDPAEWDYDHLPLSEQLSAHLVRSFELDIFYDPNGGNFYNRFGMTFVNEPVESGIPELLEAGFKLLHIPDLDFESHHPTFKAALAEIKNWSDAHPRHVPLIIMVEAKAETVTDHLALTGFAHAIPYDASAADAIDAEIKSVFGQNLNKVITPEQIKGSYATLNAGVLAGNWPKLRDARGKVLFVLMGKQLIDFYKAGRPNLEGRAMFVFGAPGNSETAFVIENSAKSRQEVIRQLVAEGYMVRTRADAGTKEARTGDYSSLDAALNSGAQIISTDYYRPDPRAGDGVWTDYKAQLPDPAPARVNPVSAPDFFHLGPVTE